MSEPAAVAKALRRARTRTLIQLGGLIERSGLLHDFGIELGADLQKDDAMKKPVSILLGGLLEIKDIAKQEPAVVELWFLKGRRTLGS